MEINLSIFDWICVGVLAAFVLGYVWVKIVKWMKPNV